MNTAPYGHEAAPSPLAPARAPDASPLAALRLRVIRHPLGPGALPFARGGWAPVAAWLGPEAARTIFSAMYERFPAELLAGRVTGAMEQWCVAWLRDHVRAAGEFDVALVGPEEESLLVRDWGALSRGN